MDKMIMS